MDVGYAYNVHGSYRAGFAYNAYGSNDAGDTCKAVKLREKYRLEVW